MPHSHYLKDAHMKKIQIQLRAALDILKRSLRNSRQVIIYVKGIKYLQQGCRFIYFFDQVHVSFCHHLDKHCWDGYWVVQSHSPSKLAVYLVQSNLDIQNSDKSLTWIRSKVVVCSQQRLEKFAQISCILGQFELKQKVCLTST